MSGAEARSAALELRRLLRGIPHPDKIHPTDRTAIVEGLIRHLFPGTRMYERLYEQQGNDEHAWQAWEKEHGEEPVLSQTGEPPPSPSKKLADWWNGRTDWIWERMRTGDRDTYFKWEQLVWQELWMWENIGKRVSPSQMDFMVNRRGFSQVQRDFLIEGLKHIDLWDEEDPEHPSEGVEECIPEPTKYIDQDADTCKMLEEDGSVCGEPVLTQGVCYDHAELCSECETEPCNGEKACEKCGSYGC